MHVVRRDHFRNYNNGSLLSTLHGTIKYPSLKDKLALEKLTLFKVEFEAGLTEC